MPVQSTYDPLSPTPYQPVPTPEQPPAPQPNPTTPSPLGDQPGFQFQGHGNISHVGAVAGVLDNVLRGYMQGKSMAEAKKALQQKKKYDDLNTSYKADADRLWTVTQKQMSDKGTVDQNSDEYKQAVSAVQGSWGALQDARKTLLDQPGGGSKKKKQQVERTPAEVFADPKATPQEKYAAMIGMSEKLGPPILGQIQNYQAQAKARAQNPEVQDADIRAKANLELSQLRTQKEPLTEAQQARVKQLQDYLTPPIKETGTTRLYESPDKSERKWLVPGQEPRDWNAVESSAQAGGKPVRAFKMGGNGKPTSFLVDPKTNQEIPGSENPEIVPPSYMLPHMSNGFYIYADNDGNVHKVPIERTTGAELPKPTAGAAGAGGQAGASGASTTKPINPYPNPEDQPPDVSLAFNKAWAKPDWKLTTLSPEDEAKFQVWAKANSKAVEGELNNPKADYDVRGHWLAAQHGDPAATLVLNKWDGKMHGNDKFKTPYNGTFSNESMYATPDAPHWDGDKLTTKDGRVVADETPKTSAPPKRVRPQKVNTAQAHSDVIGHKGIPRSEIDKLDNETNTRYQHAVDSFNKSVDVLNDPTLKLSEDQKKTAKQKLYDRLQEDNHNIGIWHSQRMRDLGLSPAEDSSPKKDSLGIL